jgi:hypothetical protein
MRRPSASSISILPLDMPRLRRLSAVSQTRADGVGALASAATCTAMNDGNSDAPAIAMTPNSASRRHLYTWLANNP